MINRPTRSLLAVLCLMLLLAASAHAAEQAQTSSGSVPGQGGDAVLPAGFMGVVWGASAEAIMAIRGGMEMQVTPDRHIRKLIDLPPLGSTGDGIVRHWTLWDDRLIEVTMFFPGEFTLREGRELTDAFEKKYGPGRLEKTTKGIEVGTDAWNSKVEKQVVEQRWLWQDPFTIQELRNNVRKSHWVNVRQSRMFEQSRDAQLQIERQEAQSKKVKSIVLD